MQYTTGAVLRFICSFLIQFLSLSVCVYFVYSKQINSCWKIVTWGFEVVASNEFLSVLQ